MFRMFNNRYGVGTERSEQMLGMNEQGMRLSLTQPRLRKRGPVLVTSLFPGPREVGFGWTETREAIFVLAHWMALTSVPGASGFPTPWRCVTCHSRCHFSSLCPYTPGC